MPSVKITVEPGLFAASPYGIFWTMKMNILLSNIRADNSYKGRISTERKNIFFLKIFLNSVTEYPKKAKIFSSVVLLLEHLFRYEFINLFILFWMKYIPCTTYWFYRYSYLHLDLLLSFQDSSHRTPSRSHSGTYFSENDKYKTNNEIPQLMLARMQMISSTPCILILFESIFVCYVDWMKYVLHTIHITDVRWFHIIRNEIKSHHISISSHHKVNARIFQLKSILPRFQ